MRTLKEFLAVGLCLCILAANACGADGEWREKAQRMFTVGDSRLLEIYVPNSALSRSSNGKYVPVVSERRVVRVTVIDKYENDLGMRIILELILEEYEWQGQRRTHVEGTTIFFSSIDVCELGAMFYGRERKITRETNIPYGSPSTDTGWYDVNFPLAYTSIPAFSEDQKNPASVHRSAGIRYSESEELRNQEYALKVRAHSYEPIRPSWESRYKKILHYDPGQDRLFDAPTSNSQKVVTEHTETQWWGPEGDWLWKKMERRDADGNIIMRCEVIDKPKEPDTGEPRERIFPRDRIKQMRLGADREKP